MTTIDIDTIKLHANGRWPSILTTVAGINGDILDGRHHPCPKCGGNDRFRMIDEAAGAVLCNKCFSHGNGDGIAATQWMLGITFPEVLTKIAEHLNIPRDSEQTNNGRANHSTKPSAKKSATVDSASRFDQFRVHDDSLQDTLIDLFCQNKPGTTLESVKASGGFAVAWPKNASGDTRCIAWAAVDNHGNIRGYILRRVNGQNFPAIGKLSERKTHMVKGSRDGWVIVGGLDRLKAAKYVWRVEGILDALALYPYLPADHAVITNICGAKSIPPFLEILNEKLVPAIGDADEPGQEGVIRFANRVHRFASTVRCVQLPYEVVPDHGKDVRDYFVEGGTFADLLQRMETASDWIVTEEPKESSCPQMGGDGTAPDKRKKILVRTHEHSFNDEVITALAEDTELYQRGGALVQIVSEQASADGIVRPETAPRISQVGSPTLRERITKFARIIQMVQGEGDEPVEKLVHPPDWSVKAVGSRGQWLGIRHLVGVVTTPVMRPDGSILMANGFDNLTGLYLDAGGLSVSVPENPTRDDAQEAMIQLHEVFADFPFEQPHHLSASIASVLTPLARHAFRGPSPLFLTDANIRGSGKSLETDVKGIIVLGNDLPRMSNPSDDDEARKRITSLAMRGDSMVLIDNINTPLGGAAIDAALTGTRWQDRILGRSEVVDMPLNITWLGTGNNVILVGDTSRRVCPIRFNCKEEKPEEREGFRHTDLRAYVRENRAALVSACLTILRAYHVAGRPQQPLPGWGSFEGWSALVRQAVVWVGMPDPATGRVDLMERSDVQAMALRQLIECWDEVDPYGEGLTTSGLLELLARNRDGYQGAKEALLELCGGSPDKLPSVRVVGNKLRSVRGRIVGGKTIDSRTNRKNQQVWKVVGA